MSCLEKRIWSAADLDVLFFAMGMVCTLDALSIAEEEARVDDPQPIGYTVDRFFLSFGFQENWKSRILNTNTWYQVK